MSDYKDALADVLVQYNRLCKEKEAAKTPREFDRLEKEFKRLMPFPGAKEAADECKSRANFGGGISKNINLSESYEMQMDLEVVHINKFLAFIGDLFPIPEKLPGKISACVMYLFNIILIMMNFVVNDLIFYVAIGVVVVINLILMFLLKKTFKFAGEWKQSNFLLILFCAVLIICVPLRYFLFESSVWLYLSLNVAILVISLVVSMKVKS